MRRHDREITKRCEIDAILSRETVCRIAFAVDGEPYIVPLSYGFDPAAGDLILHTAATGKKTDCIEANPRVCFEIEGASEVKSGDRNACTWGAHYESVIGHGTIVEVLDAEEKRGALCHLMRQQSGTESDWTFADSSLATTRVWRIRIESVTGKRSAAPE